MKNLLTISIIFILSMQTVGTMASIKPIIVTTMPEYINSGLQDLNLHWTVIDDNPRNYVLSINNTTWKNETLQSNEIQVVFSSAYGWYNITLKVFDYSGNMAYSNLIINVSSVFPVTNSALTSTPSTSYTYTASKASPGFEYLAVLPLILLCSTYTLFKRKKSER